MSKIYIEARFQMPVLDTDEFGYDKEEAEKINWEEFAKDDFWNSCEDMGELENKYDITFHKVQHKLSIPKKIAKMLDVSFDFQPEYHEDVSWIVSNMDVLSDDFSYNEFYTWVDSGKDNYNIALTYLASKALGVELVEVTDE